MCTERVRVERSFCSLCTAPKATLPKSQRKLLSNYSSTSARSLCLWKQLFLLPSLCLDWTSNLYHLCFPFRLTSNIWFPLDWKQVCWRLSAHSSLHNVDCCLVPVWKQLFPSCTSWFWTVKDLSLDFLFIFALLLAPSFINTTCHYM